MASRQAGADGFLEKPLAPTVEAAQRVVAAAAAAKRQLLVVSDPLPLSPQHIDADRVGHRERHNIGLYSSRTPVVDEVH